MATATRTIEKLYSQLSPKRQAHLVFEAIAKGDIKQADFVENCVPWQVYKTKDAEYKIQLYRLDAFANLFGVTHWQVKSVVLEVLGRLALNPADEKLNEFASNYLTCLFALDKAMEQVCESKGIDADCVRAIHSCKKVEISEFWCDENQLTRYEAEFTELLTKPFSMAN